MTACLLHHFYPDTHSAAYGYFPGIPGLIDVSPKVFEKTYRDCWSDIFP